MNSYKESIQVYIREALAYLKQTKNLWIKEDHPEIIERFENWDWETDLEKIKQRLALAYQENNFEEKVGTIAINWDDFNNNGFTLYFGSENEYQEWGDENWLDYSVDLTDVVNQVFAGIDNWYDEMEVEMNLFKDLFLGLVEIAAIHSVKTHEFEKLKKHEAYLISSASFHDAEYSMIFNSKEPVAYELVLSKEYKQTENEVLVKGYYELFGGKHEVSTKWIRGNGSRGGIMPEEISLFQNVEELQAKNEYLKNLPQALFSLNKLKDLNVSHNKLKTIGDDIVKLKSLNILDISNNMLSHLPDSLCGLEKLERLNVEYNLLKKLPSLEKLPQLDSLSAYNNEIEEFSELPESLTWLNLHNNKLKQLPESIVKLKNLKTLVLSSNFFDTFPEEILKLKSLQSLDLGGNPIADLPRELLSLTNLKELRVMPNKFSIEKRNELRKTFGGILFLGYDSDAGSFM